MRSKPSLKLITVFVLALGLLGLVAGVASYRMQRLENTAASVAHTYALQNGLMALLSIMQDVEVGARSFALTGDAAFREPFDVAVNHIQERLDAVCRLTSDNPEHRAHCAALAPLIAKRVAVARNVVQLREQVGFDAARRAIAGGEGKALMDEIRSLIGRMDAEEERLLRNRTAQTKREVAATQYQVFGGIGVAFVLLIGTFAVALRANQRHRETKARFDRFFTLSLDLFAVANFKGAFVEVNPSFGRTLGYTGEELTTRPFLDFVHPDDRAATEAEVTKLSAGVPTIAFENRYRCKDGSWRWLSWKAQPIPAEGTIYCTARDITQRKQSEVAITTLNRELQRRSLELSRTNKELEAFAYSVSHDLRAPLRSIDGFSQVVLEDCGELLTDDGKDALQRVRKAATSMGELIDALLGLSRMSRAPLRVASVDLSQLALAAADELRRTQPDRQAEIVIASPMRASGDPTLLRAVLTNLLGNAWKYTTPRAVARIEVGCFEEGGDTVYFVRDNGVGFDMAYVAKLFGAFQRLHSQKDFPGTGVGLATVHRIIHRHGGRVWAEGAVDVGAVVYFTLQCSEETTLDERDDAAELSVSVA